MYEFIEILNNKELEGCSISQKGFMWIVEDCSGRGAFGKTKDEAIDNMIKFLNKEKMFLDQN